MSAQFPDQVWDGTSEDRDDVTVFSAPDGSDWNQIVAELQAAQEYVLVPDVSTISLSNSWTNKASCAPASYRKNGNTVRLNGAIAPGTTTAGTTIFTLPDGYRPTDTITLTVCPNGSDSLGTSDFPRVTILPTGVVGVYGVTGVQSVDLASVQFQTDQ